MNTRTSADAAVAMRCPHCGGVHRASAEAFVNELLCPRCGELGAFRHVDDKPQAAPLPAGRRDADYWRDWLAFAMPSRRTRRGLAIAAAILLLGTLGWLGVRQLSQPASDPQLERAEAEAAARLDGLDDALRPRYVEALTMIDLSERRGLLIALRSDLAALPDARGLPLVGEVNAALLDTLLALAAETEAATVQREADAEDLAAGARELEKKALILQATLRKQEARLVKREREADVILARTDAQVAEAKALSKRQVALDEREGELLALQAKLSQFGQEADVRLAAAKRQERSVANQQQQVMNLISSYEKTRTDDQPKVVIVREPAPAPATSVVRIIERDVVRVPVYTRVYSSPYNYHWSRKGHGKPYYRPVMDSRRSGKGGHSSGVILSSGHGHATPSSGARWYGSGSSVRFKWSW